MNNPQKKMGTTLEDVSRRSGVSKFTVSAVLNSTRSNTRVSEETRERILRAVEELGYQPNAVARSLRRRRTDLIGLYDGHGYMNARNRFLAEIFGGLQEGCNAFDRDLVVFRIFRGHPAEEIYPRLADGKVDGLVLYAPPDDPLAMRLAESHIPVVAVVNALPFLPSVVVDDAAGGALQAEHLAQRGHRRVLYRAAPFLTVSVIRRAEAFRHAAAGYGMEVLEIPPEQIDHPDLSPAERALLTGPQEKRPTAAVCWEDGHADRLLRECRALGIRVPEDLAVIGFDGLEMDREPAWHLTTVRAPWASVAKTAVELLVARIAGTEIPPETVLPVQLVEGKTT